MSPLVVNLPQGGQQHALTEGRLQRGPTEGRLRAPPRKSTVCWRWADKGYCINDGDCRFAHGEHELVRNPVKHSQTPTLKHLYTPTLEQPSL